MGKNPLKSLAKENEFVKDLRAMVLFWRIGIRGGKKVGKKVSKDEAKDLFD